MSDLRDRIRLAINHVSAERGSDTPDFILAEYLIDCLAAFDKAVKARTARYRLDGPGADDAQQLRLDIGHGRWKASE